MVNSYDDIMGEPMDVDTHPAQSMPQATEHYAGDVLPMPGDRSMGSGETSRAVDYATGKAKDPKVKSIGMDVLKGWAGRKQ